MGPRQQEIKQKKKDKGGLPGCGDPKYEPQEKSRTAAWNTPVQRKQEI